MNQDDGFGHIAAALRNLGVLPGIGACLGLCLFSPPARAAVRLAPLFGDNMVLQRDAKVAVWGTADPGEKIRLTAGRKTVKGIAASDGRWSLQLAPMKATVRPFDITVAGTTTNVPASPFRSDCAETVVGVNAKE